MKLPSKLQNIPPANVEKVGTLADSLPWNDLVLPRSQESCHSSQPASATSAVALEPQDGSYIP